ncbi:MAG: PqqD family protein, partial [Chloroflexi bacterium]|nr:PqqD family protein [Chloroflexota bacterium]
MLNSDTHVAIPPFVERADGEDVLIGNPASNCFLSVGPDAVALLRWLAEGLTIGQASAAYAARYGETPDVQGFLASLVDQRFLTLAPTPGAAEPAAPVRGHFAGISVDLARKLCSWPALVVGALVAACAVAACVEDPSIVPSPAALVFEHDQLGLALGVAITTLVTVFFHELAHLVAARAADVPARIGVANRLWVLVAETDMRGIWLAAQPQRCVAFLAGSAVDVFMTALLLLALFTNDAAHWFALDQTVVVLVRATIFVLFTRLLWQLYLFLPTDLYYVIATLCGCKNLMQDTQAYLINQLARVARSVRRIDQSDVPQREMRVVRWFAFVWLGGRAIAFAS